MKYINANEILPKLWSWIDGMKKYGRNIKTAYLWIF